MVFQYLSLFFFSIGIFSLLDEDYEWRITAIKLNIPIGAPSDIDLLEAAENAT